MRLLFRESDKVARNDGHVLRFSRTWLPSIPLFYRAAGSSHRFGLMHFSHAKGNTAPFLIPVRSEMDMPVCRG